MAKRRRINKTPPQRSNRDSKGSDAAGVDVSGASRIDPMRFAVGMLGGALVYVCYYPSDSVAVEAGDALWFAALAIIIAAVVAVARWAGGKTGAGGDHQQPAEDEATKLGTEESCGSWASTLAHRLLEIVPWLLAAWMMLGAFSSSPPGNLRMATNEAWLWVSAAALFTASRRLMCSAAARRATVVLIVVCGSGLAVHGLHQYLVSLPANRLAYEQDPDRVLEMAGLVAPAGSAERMVFENRLNDGGPTGTFALANSLAAVLLVGVILSLGILRFHWYQLHLSQRVLWGLAALLCASCLLAARSRSATLAMLVGAALVFVVASRLRRRNPKVLVLGLGGVSMFGIGLALFIARMGNREWLAEAPASLAFRFQYWRSTWQMALDHPLWAAGPGNFQSIYSRYREPSATEQIAEPHNLFFETLASGGFVGLGLLVVTIVAGLLLVAVRRDPPATGELDPAATRDVAEDDMHDSWLWLGAGVSVLMVWMIGWASRNPPDLQASLFVVPVSILLAVLLGPSVSRLAGRDIDSMLGVAIVAITLHLLVSGGWTVPGVAIVVWLGAAILTRSDVGLMKTEPTALAAGVQVDANQSVRLEASVYGSRKKAFSSAQPLGGIGGEGRRRRSVGMALTGGCMFALLATLYLMSIRPVESRKLSMATAEAAQATGQLGKSRISLERAVEADRWSPDAPLWLADFYRWRIILGADRPGDRRQWASNLELAKQRAGDDPAVYRMAGAQQLHLYQRHGNPRDLAAAGETFQAAVDWSPSDQWMIAQLAVVARARGETEKAEKLSDLALQLSQLGGNIERALPRQLIYEARSLGVGADRGPIRRPADQLLAEPGNR